MLQDIVVGQIYKHFKGKYYIVLDIVFDCESENKNEPDKIVVYQALYGDKKRWARRYEVFASEVDHEKYPSVKQKWRFEPVEPV